MLFFKTIKLRENGAMGTKLIAERKKDVTSFDLLQEGFMGNEKWFEVDFSTDNDIVSIKCNGQKVENSAYNRARVAKILNS